MKEDRVLQDYDDFARKRSIVGNLLSWSWEKLVGSNHVDYVSSKKEFVHVPLLKVIVIN